MALMILELNDTDMCIADGAAFRLHSPGYAVLHANGIEVGARARAQSRIHPRLTHNQFWQRLGTERLAHVGAGATHAADLAYAHLNHIHREAGAPDEILLAVPGNFTREQLALLLGIARRCAFRAVGLVDSAVAAASTVPVAARAAHIDLQLHQAVITQLEHGTAGVARKAVELVGGAGLGPLQDRWARLIARCFIQQSRFDPLHVATTEQQLYDRLPFWIARLASEDDVAVDLSHGGTNYRAVIRQADAIDAVRDIYRQVIDAMGPATDASVLVSHRMAQLPGFLALLGHGTPLPVDAVAQACLRHLELIRSEDQALRFVTRLPAQLELPPATEPAPTPPVRVAPPPTHAVCDSHAFRLDAGAVHFSHAPGTGWRVLRDPEAPQACEIRREGGECWLLPGGSARVTLNGERVGGATRVFAGDVVSLPDAGDNRMLLVAEAGVASTRGES